MVGSSGGQSNYYLTNYAEFPKWHLRHFILIIYDWKKKFKWNSSSIFLSWDLKFISTDNLSRLKDTINPQLYDYMKTKLLKNFSKIKKQLCPVTWSACVEPNTPWHCWNFVVQGCMLKWNRVLCGLQLTSSPVMGQYPKYSAAPVILQMCSDTATETSGERRK